jgi:hypothetical protein
MNKLVRKISRFSVVTCLVACIVTSTGLLSACGNKPETESKVSITDTVTVTGGQIKGSYVEDNKVVEFKGIPYAASPTGENRWKAPQDVESWTGVKDCT